MPDRSRPRPVAAAFALGLLGLAAASCDSNDDGKIVEGVDFGELFAEPSAAEIAAVRAEWATRDVSAQGVAVVATFAQTAQGLTAPKTFDVTVVSHTVGGTKHYGAILVPQGLAPTARVPLVVYAHGGDGGVSVEEAATVAAIATPAGPGIVWAVPSFRAEPLRYGTTALTSDGPASPWDRDVDDALALVNVALGRVPQADPARIGAAGFSRGGLVSLLMGVRDPRVRRVLDVFGPTDFFSPYVQDVVEDALRGGDRNLAGFDVLNATLAQPLKAGTRTVADARPDLVRRSVVLFADDLPAVQAHHGTADDVVDVSQTRLLERAMRGRSDFQAFYWEGGRHDPTSFPAQWVFEAQGFLAGL